MMTVWTLRGKYKNRQRARSSDSSVAIPMGLSLATPRQTMPRCAHQQQDQVTNYKLVLV
jgi:hypothetical protein